MQIICTTKLSLSVVAREKPDTPLIRREYVSNSPQDQGFSDVESDPAPSLNEEENEEEEDAETEVEMLRRIECK